MVSHSRTIASLGSLSFLQLRCVVEVGRLGGFTAAGEALGLSKSVVSKHVSGVEDQLGIRLFERSSRRVAPTPAGARLLLRMGSLIADGEALLADVAQERAEPVGLVRIAATPELGTLVARALLPALRERHRQLSVGMTSTYVLEDLQSPAFDLAFRIGQVQDDSLVGQPLGAFRRVLVAAPSFLAACPVPDVAALAGRPCLVFGDSAPRTTWTFLGPDGGPVSVPVSGALAIRSFTALARLAEDGLGIAYVPDFLVEEAIAQGRLARVLPGHASPPSPVFLAHRVGALRVRRVAAVAALAREVLPPRLLFPAAGDA